MSTMVGQWRATYTPGDWVLLSGPTSLVFLEPPGPEHSSMINTLWEEVVASSSMSDLAARLATFPIDTMPSFAAFFWTGDGMRSLVRGSVSVIDLASGVTVAQGEGIQTWSEVGLQISQVLVETGTQRGRPDRAAPGGRRRTGVLGSVGRAAARVSSPQRGPTRCRADRRAARRGRGGPASAAAESLADADAAGRRCPWAFWAAALVAPLRVDCRLEPARPTRPSPSRWGERRPGRGCPAEPPRRRATAERPGPAGERRTRADGRTPPPPDAEPSCRRLALPAPKPTPPWPPPSPAPEISHNSLIMAVVCPYGHPSPQNATYCRTCGSPIAPQGPQLVPRPVLAVLRSSDGTTAEVDRAVLVGRAPSASAPAPARPG